MRANRHAEGTRLGSLVLHTALWIGQLLLAAFFLMAGVNHGLKPIAEAALMSPWIVDIPVGLARAIGYAELAGAVGLVLPAATRIKPWLTPLAAAGLALIMVLAAAFHLARGEAHVIGFNVLPATLAMFVAWGRRTTTQIAARPGRPA